MNREQRRATAAELVQALSSVPAAVISASAETEPPITNQAWRELFGAHADVPAAVKPMLDQVIATGRPMHAARMTLVPRLRSGSVIDVIVVYCENSDEHELNDRFLAAVSHELRAPLTTMLLWEKILRDDSADAALRAQALDAIHHSAQLQSRLVADLLDVSRAISGKLYLDLHTLEITQIVGDAAHAIAPAMLAKRIDFQVHVLAKVGNVRGDAMRLRQVFNNLLSNALKVTDPGGRVEMTLTATRRSVEIAVSDTGRGIAKEHLPHVFRAFWQHEDAMTRAEGGLGLGLTIARELVTRHGGSLKASSPGPGLGATFTVTLPLAGARHLATPVAGVRPAALREVRVLLIDDDPRVREALSHLLRRVGAIVDTAESARSAREALARHAPAVVVCDLAMPDEDGYAFIRKLRADGNAAPAIALTALAGDTEAQSARAAGFDLHVRKPIDFEQLVDGINALIAAR